MRKSIFIFLVILAASILSFFALRLDVIATSVIYTNIFINIIAVGVVTCIASMSWFIYHKFIV